MAEPGEMSQSVEDYVEAIAMLVREGRPARIRDIAARLGVSRPSVTGAVASLGEKGLALHERYGGVELTEKGSSLAAKLVHRHLTLSRFLREGLGLPPEVADRDACRLEHAMSRETYERLEAFIARHYTGKGEATHG